jgi:hypothetical protein
MRHYKLISDSRNDLAKDARLAIDLLAKEIDALSDMQRIDPVASVPKARVSTYDIWLISIAYLSTMQHR